METISYGGREIKALTGLRGVAALYVMLYHFEWRWGLDHRDAWASSFLNHGYIGVDIFFVLSGFVLAMVYGRHGRGIATPREYWNFLSHRVARIYPLYFVVTLAIAVFIGLRIGKSRVSLETIGGNLLFLQGFGLVGNLNGPSWSVAYEWISYLFFPLLMLFVDSFVSAKATPVLVIIAIIPIALICVLHAVGTLGAWDSRGPLDLDLVPVSLSRSLCGFLLGLTANRFARSIPSPRRATVARLELAFGLAILLLLLFKNSDLLMYLLVPAFILCLSYEAGAFSRLLSSRLVYMAGIISYAVYLIHFRFQFIWNKLMARLVLSPAMNHVLSDLVTGSLVIVASYAAHRVIEKPGRRAVRKLLESHPDGPSRGG